jgi:hypothetical protein
VLELEGVGREDLTQELLQEGFAEASPNLRRPEDLLKTGDVLAHLEHAPRRLVQFAQTTPDLADDGGGSIQPLPNGLVGLLDQQSAFLKPLIHLGTHLVKSLAHTGTELGDLLLQQED